jgi:hypothetical protein
VNPRRVVAGAITCRIVQPAGIGTLLKVDRAAIHALVETFDALASLHAAFRLLN